ncbi:unnamed protein product, partial [Mesorhabditis spiculigera]
MSDSDSDHKAHKKEKKQKRKVQSDSSSDEGVIDPTPVKKAKPSSSGGASLSKLNGKDAIDVGKNKFVSISEFNGKKFVDIREYYSDKATGEMKPGRKGIALSIDQFHIIKSNIDQIEKMYNK